MFCPYLKRVQKLPRSHIPQVCNVVSSDCHNSVAVWSHAAPDQLLPVL